MEELKIQIETKGIKSIKSEEKGDFGNEKYPGYRWRYWKASVPAPDFAALAGSIEASDTIDEIGGQDQGNEGLLAGPLSSIAKVWGNALQELHVEVTWGKESNPRSFRLVTHLIMPDATSQLQAALGGFAGGGQQQQNQDGNSGGSQ